MNNTINASRLFTTLQSSVGSQQLKTTSSIANRYVIEYCRAPLPVTGVKALHQQLLNKLPGPRFLATETGNRKTVAGTAADMAGTVADVAGAVADTVAGTVADVAGTVADVAGTVADVAGAVAIAIANAAQKAKSTTKVPYTWTEFNKAIQALVRENASADDITNGICYGKISTEALAHAWHIYNCAQNAGPVIVLGRCYEGKIIKTSNESFRFYDEALLKNIGITTTSSNVKKPGGILWVDFSKWSLFLNDMFIMGLIHGRRNFYLASERSKENIWPDKKAGEKKTLIVLGRELIAFHACNQYKIVSLGGKEHVTGEAGQFDHSYEGPAFGFSDYLFNIRKYLANDGKLLEELWEKPADVNSDTAGISPRAVWRSIPTNSVNGDGKILRLLNHADTSNKQQPPAPVIKQEREREDLFAAR